MRSRNKTPSNTPSNNLGNTSTNTPCMIARSAPRNTPCNSPSKSLSMTPNNIPSNSSGNTASHNPIKTRCKTPLCAGITGKHRTSTLSPGPTREARHRPSRRVSVCAISAGPKHPHPESAAGADALESLIGGSGSRLEAVVVLVAVTTEGDQALRRCKLVQVCQNLLGTRFVELLTNIG